MRHPHQRGERKAAEAKYEARRAAIEDRYERDEANRRSLRYEDPFQRESRQEPNDG